MVHLGMKTLQSVFLFTVNNVGFCSNLYFLFDTGLGVPTWASLSLSENKTIHITPIEVSCCSRVLSFYERKVGKMYKGVELGLGVRFVSFIHILLFIVNTSSSAKTKKA